MKIRALLIEDEIPARKTLKSYIRRYFPEMEVMNEAGTVEAAVKLLESEEFDLIFLDVQLEDGTGLDVLSRINKNDLRIVFTTAFSDFTLEAFQHKAFGYLLKPIDPLDFKEIINRVIKDVKFTDTSSEKIKIPTRHGYSLIEIEKIIRCVSRSNYTSVFCENNGEYLLSKTLKTVEKELLNSERFIRIHQSHLVNINFIDRKKFSSQFVTLLDGSTIPISRSRKQMLLNALNLKNAIQ